MSDFLSAYGVTAGPLGVPCTDAQAFALDRLCRDLPDASLKRLSIPAAIAEKADATRTDESWISTEDLDHDHDIVLAAGMDPAHFLLNPVVPLNHAYWLPPVGKCLRLWEHRGDRSQGIKAITHYPRRPEDFSGEWSPDEAWALVSAGLLNGKSIGFLPTKTRDANEPERTRGIRRVIEKWVLLEYSVTGMPANPFAVTSSVSKSILRALGYDVQSPRSWSPRDPSAEPELLAAFTTLSSIEDSIRRSLNFDPAQIVESAAKTALHKHTGTL